MLVKNKVIVSYDSEMNRHEIDSWGPTQLSMLSTFFNQAKEGDVIVFDETLVEENGGAQWLDHILRQASMNADPEIASKIKIETAQLIRFPR